MLSRRCGRLAGHASLLAGGRAADRASGVFVEIEILPGQFLPPCVKVRRQSGPLRKRSARGLVSRARLPGSASSVHCWQAVKPRPQVISQQQSPAAAFHRPQLPCFNGRIKRRAAGACQCARLCDRVGQRSVHLGCRQCEAEWVSATSPTFVIDWTTDTVQRLASHSDKRRRMRQVATTTMPSCRVFRGSEFGAPEAPFGSPVQDLLVLNSASPSASR